MVTTTQHLAALVRTRDARKAERDNANAVTVYRVEHKDTLDGPYHREGLDVDRVMKLHGPEKSGPQPTAAVDIPDLIDWSFDVFDRHGCGQTQVKLSLIFSELLPPEIRFGFREPGQLERWFGDSYATLAKAGYVIGEYSVPAEWLVDGDNQVAFFAPKAERVGSHPLAFVEA